MTTIIPASTAPAFLSLLPHLAGCTPRQSLVLVPFQDTRTSGVMRFDLPGPAAAGEIDRIAATVVGLVCRVADVDGLMVVVYTDDPIDGGDDLAQGALVDAVLDRADACGLRVTDALCVAADGWGSYLDPDVPPGGYPLTELEPADLGDLGHDVSGDQHTGRELPEVDPDDRDRVARAFESLADAARTVWDDSEASARVDPQGLAAVCALDDVPNLFEDSLSWDVDALHSFDVAALLWCLGRPGLRDVALAQWGRDINAGDAALEAQVRWEAGSEYPPELAQHMIGEGPAPDPRRLATALEVVRLVAALAPEPARPGPLATAAWLNWALGRSTIAAWHAERALDIDPDHGLASIVASFAAASHLPAWAFDRAGGFARAT